MNKQRNYSKTGRITQGAAIAALYVALTMIVAPIAFGPVQFRISEALCVLPYFLPSAVPGVTIGCFLANLLCGAAPLDVVFGSLATLIGAVGSYYLGKKNKWLVCVPPILANTIIVPWVLRYAYGSAAPQRHYFPSSSSSSSVSGRYSPGFNSGSSFRLPMDRRFKNTT